MKSINIPLCHISLITILFSATSVQSQDFTQYVQPLSGTAPATTIAAKKHAEAGSEKNANTIPAVTLPFAMTQWTAQTRTTEKKCIPPYFYNDSMITGFRATHWISGSCMQDYGSFTIMPVVGKLKTVINEYAMPFSHDNETATPYYYQLNTRSVSTEITSTLRCGIIRFTMLQDDSLYVLIIPNSDYGKGEVQIIKQSNEITASNPVHRIYQGWGEPAGFSGWCYIKTDRKTGSSTGLFSENAGSNQKESGAYAGFYLKKGEQLTLYIGTSFSSAEGARMNLQSEIGNKLFDDISRGAKAIWQQALSAVKVNTGDERSKKIFYTAMYHAMQQPRLYNDVNGTYPVFSSNYKLKQLNKGNYYDDFSMWDIYRAQLPLFEILNPALIINMVQSLLLKGKEGGWMPVFPCWNNYTAAMIGDHTSAFIASAFAKNIRDYDVKEAYRLMRKNAFEIPDSAEYINGKGRRALPSYLKYGYIPMEDSVPNAFHKKEQVSRTLEYAYDDYALAIMAKALGITTDYIVLYKRSLNYRNVFDKNTGMVRGRNADGSWAKSFNADMREQYITEGTPRQYAFYVPHDVAGLTHLMGGRKQLEQSLDSLFQKNEYWHGNEPGHQIPFLYNYTASPWKTQKAVREILQTEYNDGAGGLSGNDDAGQMSAWYIFAAIGFYPVDPVSGNYLLSVPIFDSIRIQLSGDKVFEIVCHKNSPADQYINSIKLNGELYSKNYIIHSDLVNGGKLEIFLQAEPSSGWGTEVKQQPPGLKK